MIDPKTIVDAGVFVVATVSAVYARLAHKQVTPPRQVESQGQSDGAHPTSAALLEQLVAGQDRMAQAQTELATIVVAHVVADEDFQDVVRKTLNLPKRPRARPVRVSALPRR